MSTSPMLAMSRAIRHTIEDFTPLNSDRGLGALPDEVLEQFVQITGAFYADLRDEYRRRAPSSDEASA